MFLKVVEEVHGCFLSTVCTWFLSVLLLGMQEDTSSCTCITLLPAFLPVFCIYLTTAPSAYYTYALITVLGLSPTYASYYHTAPLHSFSSLCTLLPLSLQDSWFLLVRTVLVTGAGWAGQGVDRLRRMVDITGE